MSRVISDILDADTVKFNHLIERWEKRTGKPGHDLKLYSDMRHKSVKAINELGLDPTDTISRELYFALQERAKQDNERLSQAIGVTSDDKPSELLDKVIAWVYKKSLTNQIWTLKPTVAKRFLKKQVPKASMKALSLRSVDSMLKRYHVAEIMTIAFMLETPEWKDKFRQNYKKLKPPDFDTSEIKTFLVEESKIEKLAKAGYPKNQFATPNFELGGVVILPYKSRFPLDVLASVVVISEILYEIRKHSALYRLLSVRKDFGNIVSNISAEGISRSTSRVADIGWNSLHRHLVGNEYLVSKFDQPFLNLEDLRAESSIDFLVRNDKNFNYWKDLEFSFYSTPNEPPISLNLIDVVVNASNRAHHHKSHRRYGRMRLWEELWARYLGSDNVIEEVVDDYLKS